MATVFNVQSSFYGQVLSSLKMGFDKNNSLRLYSELKNAFPQPYSIVYDGETYTLDKFISPRNIKDYRLEELQKLLALYLTDDKGMTSYFASLPQQYRDLLNILLKQKYVSSFTLNSIGLGNLIGRAKSGWSYKEVEVINEHNIWFNSISQYDYTVRGDYRINSFFFINDGHFWIVARYLLSDEEMNPYRTEIPESERMEIFDAELDAPASYPVINAFIMQGILTASVFRVAQALSFKVTKQLPLKDVFANRPDNITKFSIGQVLFSYLIEIYSKKELDYLVIARNAYKDLISKSCVDNIPNLLPYIKGLRQTSLRLYGRGVVINLANEILKLSDGRWIDIEGLSYRVLSPHCTLSYIAFQDMHLDNTMTGVRITPEEMTKMIDIPLMKAFFVVLYGLGGATLACEKMDNVRCETPVDHIKYVRLNEFGRYIIGLTDSYTVKKNSDEKIFELDTQHLIIRSLQKNNPYESLLFDTAVSIGGGRFKMSPESFLSKCKAKKDVDDKIKFFKEYVCRDLPPVWVDFFKNIQKRCKPLTQDNRSWCLFKLDESDKELATLLFSDDILKDIIVKVEGYRILVPRDRYPLFEQRLKQYGYLI